MQSSETGQSQEVSTGTTFSFFKNQVAVEDLVKSCIIVFQKIIDLNLNHCMLVAGALKDDNNKNI